MTEKTFVQRRGEALKDPEFTSGKARLESAAWFNRKTKEWRAKRVESLLLGVIQLRHVQELRSQGFSALKIVKQLGLAQSKGAIEGWIRGTSKPRAVNTGKPTAKRVTIKPEQTFKMTGRLARLFGHFLAGMYPERGKTYQIIENTPHTLRKIAKLASSPERTEEVRQDRPDRWRLSVPGTR